MVEFDTSEFTIKNGLQVIAGSGLATLLVFATNTVTLPTIEAGIFLTVAVYFLTAVAIIGFFKEGNIVLVFQHLLLATIVTYVYVLVLGVIWAGEPLSVLTSMQFFTTTSHVAFLIGIFTGALADAKD